MEYLIVGISGNEQKRVQVLINGKKNGYTYEILSLSGGWVRVSVDLPNAETKEIELVDTTYENPRKVVISV